MTGLEDHELVARARAGDTEAFGTLYDRHIDRIYKYVLSRVSDPEVARDLVQDTFLRAFISLPRSRLESSFAAWLWGIANHVVIDHFRRHYRWKEKLPDLVGKFVSYDSPFSYIGIEEAVSAKQTINQILAELNPKYRVIIEMRIMQDMSRGEVASKLYGEDTDENRRKVTVVQYKAIQAAKRTGERIRESETTKTRDPLSDSHKR